MNGRTPLNYFSKYNEPQGNRELIEYENSNATIRHKHSLQNFQPFLIPSILAQREMKTNNLIRTKFREPKQGKKQYDMAQNYSYLCFRCEDSKLCVCRSNAGKTCVKGCRHN